MIKKVIIASTNPVKINAVKVGFKKMFPLEKFDFKGVLVNSDVKSQPMNDSETMAGAINRTNNAKDQFKDASFWVGIEGGIEKIKDEMEAFAWIIIKSNQLKGKAKTGTFFLPKKIVELIESGEELGKANDAVFGHTNSKQKNGTIGFLTENNITRTSYYTEAVIFALIPFKNPEIY